MLLGWLVVIFIIDWGRGTGMGEDSDAGVPGGGRELWPPHPHHAVCAGSEKRWVDLAVCGSLWQHVRQY